MHRTPLSSLLIDNNSMYSIHKCQYPYTRKLLYAYLLYSSLIYLSFFNKKNSNRGKQLKNNNLRNSFGRKSAG